MGRSAGRLRGHVWLGGSAGKSPARAFEDCCRHCPRRLHGFAPAQLSGLAGQGKWTGRLFRAPARRWADSRACAAGASGSYGGLDDDDRRDHCALAELPEFAGAHWLVAAQPRGEPRSVKMREMTVDVKSLLKEGAESSDQVGRTSR